MRVISLSAILSVTILVSPTVAAAQNYSAPLFKELFRPPSTSLLTPAAPTVPLDRKSVAKSALLSRLPPRVVCGMTIVPVDPSFDSKIKHPVRSGRTRFTLRIHKPPVCGQ
jgi:hypothetical protein